jgi:hypothetical protein
MDTIPVIVAAFMFFMPPFPHKLGLFYLSLDCIG